MRVLITGGAGYIGSILARELIGRGYDVTILDAFIFGYDPIEEIKDRVKLIKTDIRSVSPNMFEGVDVVIDAAAISNDPAGNLDENFTMSINYEGRSKISALCKKVGVKRYVAPASCAIYGATNDLATEETPPNPLTAYARANMLWEKDVLNLADKTFCVTVMRQSTLYGYSPRMRFDLLVNTMARDLYTKNRIELRGDGREYRPFIHIKDDCEAYIKVLESEPDLINKQIFNTGSNEQNIKLSDLTKIVAKELGFEDSCKFGTLIDNRDYRVSFDKISKILNFKPKYTIGDGAREVYNAIKEGKLDPKDPRTITVGWYKHLLDTGVISTIKPIDIKSN